MATCGSQQLEALMIEVGAWRGPETLGGEIGVATERLIDAPTTASRTVQGQTPL
jgi:hypothetical protein